MKSLIFEYFTLLFDIVAFSIFENVFKYFNKTLKLKLFERIQKVDITFLSSNKKIQGTQKNVIER